MVGRPSRRSGSGRETFPVGREWSEALRVGLEWSRGPPEGPGLVRMPSRRARSGREAITEGWEASRRAGSGREALPKCREWSEGHPGELGVVGRPS